MGEYVSADGRTVQFTDQQTFQLANDLYQYVEHDYRGDTSVDASRLEHIIKNIQAGHPLQDVEWNILNELRRRFGKAFESWQRQGRDGQDARVPGGTGRITEAMAILPPSTRTRVREQQQQYATPSTTAKDKGTTAPHLLDSVLHDLAHTRQHIARILEPDVQANKQSIKFNAEHALNHAESAQDHAKKLDKHLAANPSSAEHWVGERQALNQMRAMQESTVKALKEDGFDSQRPHGHPTVAVDFDGVVHQGQHGLPGKIEGSVMPGAAVGLKQLAQHYRVVLLTARHDLDAVKAWLKGQGILQYFADVTNIKPAAAAYIDDRAVHFTTWKDALDAVDPQKAVTEQSTVATVPHAG